jgi:hypothetical protein
MMQFLKIFESTFTFTTTNYTSDLLITEEEYQNHIKNISEIVNNRRRRAIKFTIGSSILNFIVSCFLLILFFLMTLFSQESPELSKKLIIQSLLGHNLKAVALHSTVNDISLLRETADSIGAKIHFVGHFPSTNEISFAFTHPHMFLDMGFIYEENLGTLCDFLKNSTSTFFGRYWYDPNVPLFLERCHGSVSMIFVPDSHGFAFKIFSLFGIATMMFLLGFPVMVSLMAWVIVFSQKSGIERDVVQYSKSQSDEELLKIQFHHKTMVLDFVRTKEEMEEVDKGNSEFEVPIQFSE